MGCFLICSGLWLHASVSSSQARRYSSVDYPHKQPAKGSIKEKRLFILAHSASKKRKEILSIWWTMETSFCIHGKSDWSGLWARLRGQDHVRRETAAVQQQNRRHLPEPTTSLYSTPRCSLVCCCGAKHQHLPSSCCKTFQFCKELLRNGRVVLIGLFCSIIRDLGVVIILSHYHI